jgi:transcriptional regulator with XRE-family HTH domain
MDTLIPAFLRRQRNQRRLTLEMLSAKVGMSPQHLSEIESGKRDPRFSSIGPPYAGRTASRRT